MNIEEKRKRGRPKTLDRHHVIDVAMENYWADGPDNVSINEICRRAGVSKPGLYREFGNEDGLQQAVLVTYLERGLKPLFEVIAIDQSFEEGVDALINLFLQSRLLFATPRGCLLRDMRQCQDQLGELANETINLYQQQTLDNYADWIERAKLKDEIGSHVPTKVLATYVDLQLGNAMLLLKRNEPDDMIRDIVKLSFSVLR